MKFYGQSTSNANLMNLHFHRYRVYRDSGRGNVFTGLVDIGSPPDSSITYNEAEGSFFTYIPGKFKKKC